MTDFDYPNARIKAMASHLLTRMDFIHLASSASLQELVGKLLRTSYRKSVEVAILRSGDVIGLESGLQQGLKETFIRVRGFFKDEDRPVYNFVMRRYDIDNIKTILRGVSRRIAPLEIESALVPVAQLSLPVLKRLTQAASLREVVDHLASIGAELAAPLTSIRSHTPEDLFWMELSLEKWYFRRAFSEVSTFPGSETVLKETLVVEADLTNLFTVHRFVHSPQDKEATLERLKIRDVDTLFVEPGIISINQLSRSIAEVSLERCINHFSATPYYPFLKEGFDAYQRTKLLSELEKPLRLYQYKRRIHWYAHDPLGIGVLLGYVTLKVNEISNLRWIAHGLYFGMDQEVIRKELEILR